MTNLSLNKHQGQFKQFLKFSPLGKNRKYESLKEKLNVCIQLALIQFQWNPAMAAMLISWDWLDCWCWLVSLFQAWSATCSSAATESDPVEGVGMQIFRREHSGELRSCWSANSGLGLDSLGPQWTIGRGEHSHGSRPYAMKTQRKARNVELWLLGTRELAW